VRGVRIAFTITASVTFGIAVFVGAVVMMMSVAESVRSASITRSPEAGDTAPHFALPDLKGNVVDLTEFRGKRVVVVFWADWCPHCKEIVPDLNWLHADGIPVLAINLLESKERVAASVAESKIQYRVLLDRQGVVGRLYGAQAIPNVFVLDENGVVIEHTYGVPKLAF